MAYRFKRKEPVTKAIRRLGGERIVRALACLQQPNRAKAVHGTRKEIRKVRAVVRLIRTRIAQKEYRRLTGRLRKAATLLAAARDASMTAKALHELAKHAQSRIAPESLRSIRAALRKACDEEMKRFESQQTASMVGTSLRRVMKRLAHLQVDDDGWDSLGPGVNTAYGQSRRAYRTALENPSVENFHAWRKHVKNLWCHVRLLRAVRPGPMEAMAGKLKTLDDYLGDDHDLTILRHKIDRRRLGDAPARHALTRLIERRQQALRASALALGAGFYAEKPSVFRNRLAGYWKAWHQGKKPVPRLLPQRPKPSARPMSLACKTGARSRTRTDKPLEGGRF